MSRTSDVTRSGDLDSLPSWVSDHLGEGSPFMTDKINQSPSSPMEGSPEESPLIAVHPSVEEKTNIMTLEELNALKDTYSFPSGVQVRLPDEGEIITSTRPGEVAFYEAAFPAGLRFPIHPTIRRGTRKFCSEDTPATLRGRRASSFLSPAMNGRFLRERLGRAPQEFRGRGGFQISTAIILLGFMATKRKSLKRFSDRSRSRDASPYPCYWNPNYFAESLSLPVLGRRGWRAIICRAEKRRGPRAMWLCQRGLALKRSARSSGTPAPAKGVVIGEKKAGESITSSPSKKGKADDGSKGKGIDIDPEGKKKASSLSKASAAPTVVPSRPGEGTSSHLGAVPGPTPSILGSPSVAERLLRGVIPPADKEKVDKLTLDQTATKLFHALVLGSSLAVRSREAVEQASLQEGRVASMETEALDELAKAKGDRDSLADHLGKSGALVNELREALNKAKESAVEEFKSSSEFMVAVEDAASKYFWRGVSTSARCNFGGIIPTSLSISRAPWSIKICWRSRTKPLRRKREKI
ncbi:hypothetical protein Acr_18g0006780 [Actinidia rufa]|uniref:Uncharacterized protein n=1 Tax=Actinidia rufa TaxID=165716 RepID=A0A7J0G6U5_9ERIC|nr:hypothetical protein Acr_18g0006780 [Actinidia rufa]